MTMSNNTKTFDEILKFNPYHDRLGRFTTSGGASSFTYAPGKSKAHDNAIQNEKQSAKGFKGTLYHGSPETDIEEFDIGRAGKNTSSGEKLIYFTDSKQMADDFSYERLEGSSKFTERRGKKGRVYEVEVEMKNPLDFRNLSDTDVDNILKLDAEGLLTRDIVRSMGSNHQLLKASLNLNAESLSKLGYDGIIANTGKAGHNSLEYAVISSKQTKIKKSVTEEMRLFDEIVEIEKFNPYHDSRGRFTTAGGASSFTYAPGKSKAHNNAIERHKERMAAIAPTEAQAKTLKGIESRTRNLKKEQFRVVDREGNVVMQKQGDKNSVSYSIGEARDNFPGNITIHNHPDGGTFSSADLSDIGHGATEIRAASPEGTYILRNLNHGTKWRDGQKTWLDMRNDIDAASQEFKSARQLKAKVREPYEQQVKPIMERWSKRRDEGAPQDELNKIAKEYTSAWDALQPQVEQATRKAYVDQYHSWYKSHAGEYGFEYEFVPVSSKTRKGYTIDDTEDLEKSSGEVVLDRKIKEDVDEIMAEVQQEYPRELTEHTEKSFSVFKTDDDKRLVFGWASISITVDGVQLEDRQQDMIDPEDLEEAAYEYVLNFRDTGEEHISTMRKKGKLVESCVFTAEKQKAMGIPEGTLPVGWWIGFKIDDDAAWEKVKNGTYRMFSIEGRANREPVEKSRRDYDEYPSYDMWLEENLDATIDEQKAAKEYYQSHKEEAERNWKHDPNPKSVAKTFSDILEETP